MPTTVGGPRGISTVMLQPREPEQPRPTPDRDSRPVELGASNNERAFERIAGLPPLACIVGAPRCGTTTYARWLRRRPEVCFSKIKEPHFFTLADLRDASDAEVPTMLMERYVDRFFPHREAATELLAEGSVSYLYAPERLRPMLKVWPNAKFIIALRDPFAMLPSVHQRLLFQGDEVVKDFASAWRLQKARREGRSIPRSCIDARQLQYLEVARLGEHVRRMFATVGRENCHVILFDDLQNDPTSTYLELLEFLGLEDDGFRDFSVNRPSRSFRYGWLQRLLKRPTFLTKNALAGQSFKYRFAAAPAKPSSLIERALTRARRKLLKWNQRVVKTHNLPPELQEEIRELLSDDVQGLAKLIGRDLSHWLGGKSDDSLSKMTPEISRRASSAA